MLQKCVQQFPKWGCGCDMSVHGVRAEGFYGVEVLQPFRSFEMSVRGFQMVLVCQKVVSQLRNSLRNGALVAKIGSFYALAFRSYEMRVTML